MEARGAGETRARRAPGRDELYTRPPVRGGRAPAERGRGPPRPRSPSRTPRTPIPDSLIRSLALSRAEAGAPAGAGVGVAARPGRRVRRGGSGGGGGAVRSAAAARPRAAHARSEPREWQRRRAGGGGAGGVGEGAGASRRPCVGETAASLRGLWCGGALGDPARPSRDGYGRVCVSVCGISSCRLCQCQQRKMQSSATENAEQTG